MAYHQAPTGSRGFSGFPKAPNHIWPCHVIAYICANTGTSALTFLNYYFGKGQYFFIPRKVSKVKHFLEGFGHPNLMNPFEYGKSLPGKSFPKRIGTLTPPNQKIFRGHHVASNNEHLLALAARHRMGKMTLTKERKTG